MGTLGGGHKIQAENSCSKSMLTVSSLPPWFIFPEPVLLRQSLTVADGLMLINLYVQPPRKDSRI